MKTKKRGGKRNGAGRPAPNGRGKSVTFYLCPPHIPVVKEFVRKLRSAKP